MSTNCRQKELYDDKENLQRIKHKDTCTDWTYLCAHPRCWTFCLWRSMRLLCCTDGPRCWAVFLGAPRDTLERTGQSVVSHRSLPFFQPADPQSQVFCFLKKNLNQEQDSDPRVLHWVNPELRLPLPPHSSLLNLAQDLLWNIND